MATVTDIVNRVRLELADLATPFTQTFTGDGSTAWNLSYYPVDASTVSVTINGAPVSNTSIGVEERTGRLVFSTAPPVASAVVVTGTHYRYFSTNDLSTFVADASEQHTANRTDAFGRKITLGVLPSIEEYPLALLATVNSLYALATDAAFDIDIQAPDGVTIPRSERYRQLMDMIAVRQAQYQQLCQLLNIGLFKIDVFTFRRISKATNRYVPIFVPQEIDDPTAPQRIYLPIPTYGSQAVPQTAAAYDWVLTQGDSVSTTFEFGFDLTNYTLAAQVRRYPSDLVLAASFGVTVVDVTTGVVTLSLTAPDTMRLPLRGFWDLQITDVLNPAVVNTLVSGLVFVNRQVTQ